MTIARESLAEHSPQSATPPGGVASWYTPGLSDGLGDRLLMFDNSSSVPLELLRFPRPFSQSPTFEAALRRRIDELKDFAHPAIGTIRSIQWLGIGDGLALVSNHVPGRRLSEALGHARGPAYATELLRQLTDLLAALERQGTGIAHGAINADRVIITETGRLVLVEHVLGSALATLCWPAGRTRTALDVPMPPANPNSAFDSRTDVFQLAFLALSVTLGRRIHQTDDPKQSALLLNEASRPGLTRAPISATLRHWFERALQVDGPGFATAADAQKAYQNPLDDQYELPPPTMPRVGSETRAGRSATTPASVTRLKPRGARPAAGTAPTPAERAPGSFGDRVRRVWARVEGAAWPAGRWVVPGLVAVVALEAAAIGILAARASMHRAAALDATVLVDAPQPGEQVFVDGKPVGVTPIRVGVASATHSIRIQPPAVAGSGGAAGADPTTKGTVEITSEPSGARISVDGAAAGLAPLSVPMSPGAHEITVSNGTSSITRTVSVTAGKTATVMAALTPVGSAAGWVTIGAPVELQVLESGTLIGTTAAPRLMLPVGRHDLVLSNATLGFEGPLRVDVASGKTASATVTLPNGSVSINALPWASVTLDGRDLGTTPVANVEVPLGTHDVVLRHPQFGERRQSILVTAKSPVRLVVDFSKR